MSELYHKDQYLREAEAIIISLYDEDGQCCIELDDDLFYPQGGGQKGDRGVLIIDGNEFRVTNTVKGKYGVGSLLLVEPEVPFELQDKKVKCILDWNFRFKQMRLHTCVHFHHCMLETVAGKPIPHPSTSSIEDGFAFNRYEGHTFDLAILDEANAKFQEVLQTNTPVITYPDKDKEGFRWWECAGFKIPCGGLHVRQLDEIGEVKISSSTKKGKITIKFTL
ncbi:MAG: alanyl-tRNA editing protein [Oscillospiraceae bacterium]|nr:alanyl-tRNA editing protein [Oscillospiraceae bacterium]